MLNPVSWYDHIFLCFSSGIDHTFNSVRSQCENVNSTCDGVGGTCDGVGSTCDGVGSTCVYVGSTCGDIIEKLVISISLI